MVHRNRQPQFRMMRELPTTHTHIRSQILRTRHSYDIIYKQNNYQRCMCIVYTRELMDARG